MSAVMEVDQVVGSIVPPNDIGAVPRGSGFGNTGNLGSLPPVDSALFLGGYNNPRYFNLTGFVFAIHDVVTKKCEDDLFSSEQIKKILQIEPDVQTTPEIAVRIMWHGMSNSNCLAQFSSDDHKEVLINLDTAVEIVARRIAECLKEQGAAEATRNIVYGRLEIMDGIDHAGIIRHPSINRGDNSYYRLLDEPNTNQSKLTWYKNMKPGFIDWLGAVNKDRGLAGKVKPDAPPSPAA